MNLFEMAYQEEKERLKMENQPIKINSLELENVKRVKAVKLEPTTSGLTVVGGKNNQGKTSVLDSIAWLLGGDKYKPSKAKRDGSMVDPKLHIELTNGLVVERTGKNGTLKVTDSTGQKGGQRLLDQFISSFALDLPKFMGANSKEKANIVLQIIGVGEQLGKLEADEQKIYNERYQIGRIKDQKQKYADEMIQWDNVPEQIVSAAELIQQQQAILAKNGENQRKRSMLEGYTRERELLTNQYNDLMAKINELQKKLEDNLNNINIATASTKDLQDESTAELEQSIENIDTINAKVRDNLSKEKALEEAKQYMDQYNKLTKKLEDTRKEKYDLLKNADMPLPELTVEDGELIYKGQQWYNMSGSQQLMVATAIVRKLNPKCGFVLLDKLEQMDLDTLGEFSKWLEQQGLQAIATRVSTGDECSIYIEDGYSVEELGGKKTADEEIKPATAWKVGTF